MRSIEKLSCEEKEIKVLIDSLKNVLTDVPYDFEYDDADDNTNYAMALAENMEE